MSAALFHGTIVVYYIILSSSHVMVSRQILVARTPPTRIYINNHTYPCALYTGYSYINYYLYYIVTFAVYCSPSHNLFVSQCVRHSDEKNVCWFCFGRFFFYVLHVCTRYRAKIRLKKIKTTFRTSNVHSAGWRMSVYSLNARSCW